MPSGGSLCAVGGREHGGRGGCRHVWAMQLQADPVNLRSCFPCSPVPTAEHPSPALERKRGGRWLCDEVVWADPRSPPSSSGLGRSVQLSLQGANQRKQNRSVVFRIIFSRAQGLSTGVRWSTNGRFMSPCIFSKNMSFYRHTFYNM